MLFLPPVDAWRWLSALLLIAAYLAYCVYRYLGSRPARTPMSASRICVIYASQTGQAEALAEQAAAALNGQLFRLEDDWQAAALKSGRALFVASTYGQGSAPDHALRFARERIGQKTDLHGLEYGLLALGDSHYRDFCAFGRQLDAWLQASNARPLFARIETNRLDADSLARWENELQALGASPVSQTEAPFCDWQFISRQCLNPGSPGAPIFLVTLQGDEQQDSTWQAGDLVDLIVPDGDGVPRAYSIANLSVNGRIELIVRTHVRDDGQTGLASGWLNEIAQAGDAVQLRIRSNPGFHLQHDPARPVILIGSGTGFAGLRAHLQARARATVQSGKTLLPRNAWLFFGERSSRHDTLCRFEIESWQRARVLSKVDLTFSRDDPVAPYVQDSLMAQAREVCEWIEGGADILICGSAQKMAVGVDRVLRKILGSDQVDALLQTGRIRRDVF